MKHSWFDFVLKFGIASVYTIIKDYQKFLTDFESLAKISRRRRVLACSCHQTKGVDPNARDARPSLGLHSLEGMQQDSSRLECP